MEEKICPQCGTVNQASANFCIKDGVPLEKAGDVVANTDTGSTTHGEQGHGQNKICHVCGTVNPITAKFCKKDGSPLEIEAVGAETADIKRELPTEDVKKNEYKEIDSRSPRIAISTKKMGRIDNLKNMGFHQLFPPVGGFLIALVFFGIVSVVFRPTSYVYRLFLTIGDPSQRIIPFLTVFLCLWSFLHLIFLKLMTVRKEKRGLKDETISALPQLTRSEGVKSALDKVISKKNIIGELLLKRISSLFEELDSSGDVQRSHEVFRHQSEIDSDTASSGYATVKLFIWAMPILGFLGTVVGIGLAVGNFSSFLTGDIENIEMVKRELSKVATGLSYAFDTTLLGLATSLLTMILMSFVQNREEGFLTELDALCLRIISNFKTEQSLIPDKAINDPMVGSTESLESFQKELRLLTEELSGNLKVFTDNFSAASRGLSKEFAEFPAKLQNEGKDIKESINDLQKFSQVLEGILENSNKQFKESFANLSSHVEPLHSTLNANIQTINTLNSFNHVLAEMQRTLSSLTPLLSKLSGPLELRLVPSQHEVFNPQVVTNPKNPETKEGS